MKMVKRLDSLAVLALTALLHGSYALPANQPLRKRAEVDLLHGTQCKKRVLAQPNTVIYDLYTTWENMAAASAGANSSISATCDDNDVPFLVHSNITSEYDTVLFSFKVTNDLVEDTAGYQFGNNADLVAKTGLHPLVGPYGIQLGAPAAPGVVEGSAPKTIHIEVRRGEDAGTATINIADCKLEPTVTAEPTETYEQTMSPEP